MGSPERVAGLVLAAGGGRRLGGRAKALLNHRGRPLVERADAVLREGGCAPVHIVVGASADKVRERARLTGSLLVDNPDWESGMGSSLRAGLVSLRGVEASALVVMLVDQPRIGSGVVARLIAAHRAGADLVAASYGGERGHPVLVAARYWDEVADSARGDRGARDFLLAHARDLALVECSDIAAPDDVDTPDALTLLEG
ncbi:nucleotidyltransferase family protein [Wenjunlia tyrosinilytica]|uniref:4-diphosphocytidyl-2C-methyl-D-erythritol synthase n=1 Tax=Wenjunlia tyrosinilytica TaxID=1544741 RepID=A0A917ZTE7_9ACTN|nr:nucleotidyltransferase family protein [Wenjunlia tyrosinilytica]GGO92517.1 4-diphosphocytidyl-2C-methyl-D-erythritol synthase [Wenjunlia tyrosinilytica]